MRFLSILLMSAAVLAGQDMSICILNRSGLPDQSIERAKKETAFVFAAAGIRISWAACDSSTVREDRFFVRLRGDKPPKWAGPASLEAMGAAVIPKDGRGYLVDAYPRAVESLATRYETDVDALLGYVIAHELGHMLLGSGHTADGIMRPIWRLQEINALRRRWLRFNQSQCKRMLLELRSRTSRSDADQ